MNIKSLLLLTFLTLSATTYGKDIVIDKGNTLQVDTITVDNRTLLKLRDFSDILGLQTKWNSQEQSVEIKDNKYDVKLYNGKYQIAVNGEIKNIDTPPVIKDGVTYVPLRVIGNAFGYITSYENDTIKVITRKENSESPIETIGEFKDCISEYTSLYNTIIEKSPFSSKEEYLDIETRLSFIDRKLTRNSRFLDGKETTIITNAMERISYFASFTSKDRINYEQYYNDVKADYLEVMKIADKVIKTNSKY